MVNSCGSTKTFLVKFYDDVADELLKFAVIIAKKNGKFVFCKHKERDTWEVPGGHRESEEKIDDTAKRKLYEETGATKFRISPISVYSVTAPNNFDSKETFGKLYFANIEIFESELYSEIEKIVITDRLPEKWTYPDIQPQLLEEAENCDNVQRGFIFPHEYTSPRGTRCLYGNSLFMLLNPFFCLFNRFSGFRKKFPNQLENPYGTAKSAGNDNGN